MAFTTISPFSAFAHPCVAFYDHYENLPFSRGCIFAYNYCVVVNCHEEIEYNILKNIDSDSDQKSIIDHFRLIGPITTDFFFDSGILITDFQSLNFWMIVFFDFLYTNMTTCQKPKWKWKSVWFSFYYFLIKHKAAFHLESIATTY